MESLKMKQAYVEAQLSDDPDSPVVRMRTTSEKVTEYVRLYADMQGEWNHLRARMQKGEVGPKEERRVAKLYKRVIKAACGANAYKEAVAWLRGDEDIETKRLNALLTPLVSWITANILDLAHPRAVSEAIDGIEPQGSDS